MKLRLYLDQRDGKPPYPLRLGISKKGDAAYITLSVRLLPEQWDQKEQHTRRLSLAKWPQGPTITNYIEKRRADIENVMLRLEADGVLHRMTARQIRDRIMAELNGDDRQTLLSDAFSRVIAQHHNARTRQIYRTSLERIRSAMPGADSLTLEDITPEWLRQLDRRLQSTGTPSVNARNVHMRNIRAVMNWAITEGLTDNYPFRRYRLRHEQTRKRSLTSADIRRLAALELTGFDREYRDIFLLIFALIGINITDLFCLDHESLNAGRITYRRAKTGTMYDIRVEPAAAELLERYRGESGLLCIRDRYRSARDYTQHINAGLKRLIQEPPFTELSTYWARHSWATIAYNELGASMDTISAALGHKYGSRVTAIYINPDQKRVDELNRQMMRLVFGEAQKVCH